MRRLFERRFSVVEVVGLLAFVVVWVAIYAYAITTVPHTFTVGTTAKATEVNENFQALASAIDAITPVDGGTTYIAGTGITITGNTIAIATGGVGSTQIADNSVSSTDVGFNYAGSSTKGGVATDSDLLDGKDSTDFALAAHIHDVGSLNCAGNNPNDIMVKVGPICVDKYQASVWSNPDGTGTQYGTSSDDYPFTFPDSGIWATPLYAVSKAGAAPSRYISWSQAHQACTLSGKRLLTVTEFQIAATGNWGVNNLMYLGTINIPDPDSDTLRSKEWLADLGNPYSLGTAEYDDTRFRCAR